MRTIDDHFFRHQKKIGPRILSIITARLINDERRPTEFEERFCLACEVLNDKYLRAFKIDYDKKVKEREEKNMNTGSLFIHTEIVNSIGTGMNKVQKPPYLLPLINCGVVEESMMVTSLPSQGGPGPQLAHNMTSYHYEVSFQYESLMALIDFATF